MRDRRCFVQFIHPGKEHGPDRGDLKSWNRGDHRRKFMNVTGAYVADGDIVSAPIAFWGEWEPPSRVIARFPGAHGGLPSFVHEPLAPIPDSTGWRQNTDPFVFGERFLYTGCMQHTSLGATQLRHLAAGSVVLFGSCLDKSRFVLDTAFVVSDFVDHGAEDVRRVVHGRVADDYWDVTLDPWYSGSIPAGRTFRLYFGATPVEPFAEMFSFFPCRRCRGSDQMTFARPEVRIPGFVTSNLSQGKKIARDLSPRELRDLWDETARQVRAAGLSLGVRADLPRGEKEGQMSVPFGLRCTSKREFTEVLRVWHAGSVEETIGDVGTYGRQAWLWADLAGFALHLNADTKRSGVEAYLERVAAHGVDQSWHIVPNRNGLINKVAPGEADPIPGFYLYTSEPLAAPTTI